MLYSLNLYNFICQLYNDNTGRNNKKQTKNNGTNKNYNNENNNSKKHSLKLGKIK